MRRRIVIPVCRRWFRESDADPRNALIVAGAPRSGTTWLGELLAHRLHGRLMFEPFFPGMVPQYRGFHTFQYARPDRDDPELAAYCRLVLSGAIRNPWVDRAVTRLRPRHRIVKTIRANLLLAWLRRELPEVPIISIVRHPCAVVVSRMQAGWRADDDLASARSQRELVEDHLAPQLDVIDGATTQEEKHALVWCINVHVPQRQLGDAFQPIFYEDLLRDPRACIDGLLVRHGLSASSAMPLFLAASGTTFRGSPVMRGRPDPAAFKRTLDAGAIARVLRIVAAFGLDGLYGDDGLPAGAA